MLYIPACVPCIVKQAHTLSSKFAGCSEEIQFKILGEVCDHIKNVNSYSSAIRLSGIIQDVVEKYLGKDNPYEIIKKKNIKIVKEYEDSLNKLMENSDDKIEMALRIAITGNTIDIAANPDFCIQNDIDQITSDNIILPLLEEFREKSKKAGTILYIGDNYEEAFFDKYLLSELLPAETFFAVRSRPILNDITLSEAKDLGINKICKVIESGSTIAGTDLEECSSEFMDIFNKADIVIAKGQGNYESLFRAERKVYFLFKIKCSVVSLKTGYSLGKGVLISNH
jgi:uncharacterized protein with ATP-grasp and redox domains